MAAVLDFFHLLTPGLDRGIQTIRLALIGVLVVLAVIAALLEHRRRGGPGPGDEDQ